MSAASPTTTAIDQGEWRITKTWIDRKPTPDGKLIVAFATFILVACSYVEFQGLWPLADYFSASWQNVMAGGWYKPWTTLLVHGDIGHLISNSFFFVIFGYLLAEYFGAWLFPLATFFLSGLVNIVSLATYPPQMLLIGASGMVNVMGGTWLALYFLLARNRKPWSRFLRSAGVLIVLFLPHEYRQGVSERTHIIGLLSGLLLGVLWFRIYRTKFQRAERWKYIPPEPLDVPDAV